MLVDTIACIEKVSYAHRTLSLIDRSGSFERKNSNDRSLPHSSLGRCSVLRARPYASVVMAPFTFYLPTAVLHARIEVREIAIDPRARETVSLSAMPGLSDTPEELLQ